MSVNSTVNSKSQKSRRFGQIIRRGDNKFLVRIFTGTEAGGKRHYHNQTIRDTKKDADKYRFQEKEFSRMAENELLS